MSHMLPLPTVPGRVHGIVSLDPLTIQCDGCGLTDSKHGRPGLAVLLSHITFSHRLYPTGGDRRRLCDACKKDAGWSSP